MSSESMLSQRFVKAHPTEAVKRLEALPATDIAAFIESLSPALAARIFELIMSLKAVAVLEGLDKEKAAAMIAEMSIEPAAAMLRRMESVKCWALVNKLPDEIAKSLALLLHYPENTAGALMNPQTFTLFGDLTAKEALDWILKDPKHLYYHIPVTDRAHHFLGMTDTRELMLSTPDHHLSSLTHTGVGRLSPNLSREGILAHPDWQLYHELPVVDDDGIFLGVIDYQTLRRLELELQGVKPVEPSQDTGRVLGELYWIGLAAFFKGAVWVMNPESKEEPRDEGGATHG